jgi:hypothetical protein
MDIDRVNYKNGRAYIELVINDPRYSHPKRRKYFGQVVKCIECGKDYFLTNSNLKIDRKHYCSDVCQGVGMKEIFKGENNPMWKGGIIKNTQGYIEIKDRNHPLSSKEGYVKEHRLVMEKVIGRFLHRFEVVHHINQIRDDNRIENLILFKNQSAHIEHHNALTFGKM